MPLFGTFSNVFLPFQLVLSMGQLSVGHLLEEGAKLIPPVPISVEGRGRRGRLSQVPRHLQKYFFVYTRGKTK